jgi:hypothetical protein
MKRAFILLLLVGIALPAAAQKQPIEVDSCLYKIPKSEFKRVGVFLEATSNDSASAAILPAADLFTQTVAYRIRALVGKSETTLIEADSAIAWWTVRGEVVVVVRPEGKFTWRVPEWSAGVDTMPRSSLALLRRAITDVAASGEWITWPEGNKQDSLTFGLSLVTPRVTKDRKVIPVKARQPVAVFTLMVPWEKSVEVLKSPNAWYPDKARNDWAIGMVRLAFLVDKSGRAKPETIKEVFLPGELRPRGEMAEYYNKFLKVVTQSLPSARFSPAVIGGCVMKQMVQQTFEFKLDR